MRPISAARALVFRAALRQVAGPDVALFPLGRPAFGTLHEAPPPCIGCGVADRAERRQPGGRGERAAREGERRFERESLGGVQPCRSIFEEYGLGAPHAVASGQPNRPRVPLQIDVDLEVSHRRSARRHA